MKKTTSLTRAALFVLLAMFTSVGAWAQDLSSLSKDGETYLIKSTDDLDALATFVNNGGETKGLVFKLTDDITYAHTTDWDADESTEHNYTAIGYYDESDPDNDHDYFFDGTFDGNGQTISGIRIYKDGGKSIDQCQGVFGQLSVNAIVKNLTLKDARIVGYCEIGGIAGWNAGGTIENCQCLADVYISCNAQDYSEDLGSIAGFSNGNIINCTSSATIALGDGESDCKYYGGIVGDNYNGTVEGCTSSATITIGHGASDCDYFGGIVGRNDGGTVEGCTSDATITLGDGVKSCDYYGNIVGYNRRGTVEECTSLANIVIGVNAEDCSCFGGIVGKSYNKAVIKDCTSKASIGLGDLAKECTAFGGIVGHSINDCIVKGCTSSAALLLCDGVESCKYVGGIVGYLNNNSLVEHCISSANIAVLRWTDDCQYFGGIVGYNDISTLAHNLALDVNINCNNFSGAILGWNSGGTLTDNIYSDCEIGSECVFIGTTVLGGLEDTYVLSDIESNDGAVGLINLVRFNDAANNTQTINSLNGQSTSVVIIGRTLKAGHWNSLCLPFDLSAAQIAECFGEGTEVKTLDSFSNDGTTLTFRFKACETIEAGKPYIVHIPEGENILNPVFKDVTIKNVDPMKNFVLAEDAVLIGLYANIHTQDGGNILPKGLAVLFLQNDKIYYINEKGVTINAFRALFGVNLDVSELPSEVRILIDWGDDEEATGIASMEDGRSQMEDVWYTLDGRKLDGKPSVKGIYMYNGTKVAVQ